MAFVLRRLIDALRVAVADVDVSVDRIRPRHVATELARDEVDVVVGRGLRPSSDVDTRALGEIPAAIARSDDLADVAAGAGVALVPAGGAPRPEVRLVALRDRLSLPVQAAWRRGGARPIVARFVAAAQGALAGRAG